MSKDFISIGDVDNRTICLLKIPFSVAVSDLVTEVSQNNKLSIYQTTLNYVHYIKLFLYINDNKLQSQNQWYNWNVM